MFGIMAVLLGSGDAFHLVPRAVALCTTGLENFTVQMGLGKWITSITMTILKSSPPQNLQQIVANFLYPFILQKYLFLTFFLQIFILQKSYHHLQYILYMFCIIISPFSSPFSPYPYRHPIKGLLQDLAHSRSCLLSPTTR